MDATLLDRKRELYDALHTLDRDLAEGSIDAEAYEAMRNRYEEEAATVLQQIDAEQRRRGFVGIAPCGDPPKRRTTSGRVKAIAILASLTAVGIFLASALHARSATTAAPTPIATSSTPTAITAALASVAQHPHRVSALLALGNAYMDSRDTRDAEAAYRRAGALAPNNPEPQVLVATALASAGRRTEAEAILRRVETAHPAFARAWLLDGLLSARSSGTLPHAAVAWKHFLKLQPRGTVAQTVRRLLAAAEAKR
jgi:cytochrome c-type biogenesis protein CcmH/NrfG